MIFQIHAPPSNRGDLQTIPPNISIVALSKHILYRHNTENIITIVRLKFIPNTIIYLRNFSLPMFFPKMSLFRRHSYMLQYRRLSPIPSFILETSLFRRRVSKRRSSDGVPKCHNNDVYPQYPRTCLRNVVFLTLCPKTSLFRRSS